MKTYEVKTYHTSDNSEKVAAICTGYSNAVKEMKLIAQTWSYYAKRRENHYVVTQRNRIEYRSPNYGMAVYIEEVTN